MAWMDPDRLFANLERLNEGVENLNELIRQGVEAALDQRPATGATPTAPTGSTGLPVAAQGDPVYVFARHAVAANATWQALEIIGELAESGKPLSEDQRARAIVLVRTALDLRDDWPPTPPPPATPCPVCGVDWPDDALLDRAVDILGGIGPAEPATLALCPACRGALDQPGGTLNWGKRNGQPFRRVIARS